IHSLDSEDVVGVPTMRSLLTQSALKNHVQRTSSCWARCVSTAEAKPAVEARSPTALGLKPRSSGLPKPQIDIKSAISQCKELSRRKFDETVDIAVQLGVDPRKPNQSVRGVVSLPNGTGKQVRIAVFARGPKAEEAKAAGASIVGAEDLVALVQGGKLDFDRCIATPDVMPLVGRVARILGPRGLMPNPKLGTVTHDVADAIAAAKGGQVEFRAEKKGIIHAGVGKTSFSEEALLENVRAFMVALSDAKPEGAKGKYIKAAHVSTTMGPGIALDVKYIDPSSAQSLPTGDALGTGWTHSAVAKTNVSLVRHLEHVQAWLKVVSPALRMTVLEPSSTGVEDAAAKRFLDAFLPLLTTNMLGQVVLYSPALSSTQTWLHETLQPAVPASVLCYTDLQLQGKGRGSNTWNSPEGCLTFSFKSSFTDGNTLPFVQYLVSLAIVRAIEAVYPPAQQAQPVRIKWPNDIYADKVKIGGILCQSDWRDGQFSVTTGIGINISNRDPTVCLQDVLATDGVPHSITKEQFLAAFCNAYEPMQAKFLELGFTPFMDDYIARWLHSNQVVQVSGDAGASSTVPATIKGLTTTGCLLAEGADGETLELYPDGNSFDF
ncbi:TPA: hypothetical protein N0F65_012894, partial [Lagenidium giganteum]